MVIPRAIFGLALGWAFAQLSGIVNQYAAVVSSSTPSSLIVDDPTIFSPGDRILIYQAKGATINTTNDADYGNITAINGSGIFEFNTITSITGSTLNLKCALTRPFDLSNPTFARIQVIKVSYHPGDVTISGTVTAPPWNGEKGGVVVIETEGTLTFNADIDVSGRGFRGGSRSDNGGSSSACNVTTYHGGADEQAGRKGEGITEWLGANHRGYRGKLANGGGGGNNHNTGGGGGGNYGSGGAGGWTTCGSRWLCNGQNVANSGFGIGGTGLSSYVSGANLRLFFGGGGGGGHQNNQQGGNGGNGGGIVIIRAASINGNGHHIIASGIQGVQNLDGGCGQVGVSFAGNDGGGGGGAGGSVAIFCNSFIGSLTIDVRGANGQNCSSHLCACFPDHGPGGGGGGGYVAFSTAALPPGVTAIISGGQNGIELTPLDENQYGCTNTGNCISSGPARYNRGAAPGGNGGVIYGISLSSYAPCPMSQLTLREWHTNVLSNGQLQHRWKIQAHSPIISLSLQLIEQKGHVQQTYSLPPVAVGEFSHPLAPGVYEAQLIAYTADGTNEVLDTKLIDHRLPFVLEGGRLFLTSSSGRHFTLYDAAGRAVLQGTTPQVLSLENLPSGLYLLQIEAETHRFYKWD
ncbi:MAG: T9SS type A sorting domain-containing protein [Bacteroidia bacterium]|nr:T9SS type A sorting domain-containing protein [Bacteroidia bacterium]